MDATEHDALLLQIDGFEGPIDVLLQMARDQKVDLRQISVLQLARQYLAFIDRARELRLELAAEYLVMAAWLAYLKSRLLLPVQEEDGEEMSGEQMAEALAFQLRRLEAMQEAGAALMESPRLGRSIFGRGAPEGLSVSLRTHYDVSLYDLIRTYGEINRRKDTRSYDLPVFALMTMERAISRMEDMLGRLPRKGPYSVWTTLHALLPEGIRDKLYGRSAVASMFTAGLEMVRQGKMEIRQDAPFRPIYLRAKEAAGEE